MNPSQTFNHAARAYIGQLIRRGRMVAALVTIWHVTVIRLVLWLIPSVASRIDVRNALERGRRILTNGHADVQTVIEAKTAEIADLRRRIAALRATHDN